MGLSSLFSGWTSTIHADAAPEKPEVKAEGAEGAKEEEKEEEEEPEDVHPGIKEECAEMDKCRPAKAHFEHCQQKVQDGKGFKHEDCVEEILMHCVDNCAAPKLFSKLA